jgi:hypothetical protein
MSWSIINNSTNVVISGIGTESSTYGSLEISSGQFPCLPGEQVDGSQLTELNNLKGSPYSSLLLFIQQGSPKIEVLVDDATYSEKEYSSGIATIQLPIIPSNAQDIVFLVDDAI